MTKKLTYLSAAAVALVYGAPTDDLVSELPGMDQFTFNAYSGYLNVGSTTKSLHYMFVESQNDPTTDPVLIWFNGGPGCSSMLGWIQEHGPYVMESGTDYFHKNEYSWNNFANVLYIESPGGVGYSTCSGKECIFDDNNSAQDNLDAILYFYNEKFPEFKSHDLYISGESYAGIYVPYVVNAMDEYIQNNKYTEGAFIPNLKGFMVGNGCTNWDVDTTPAYVEMGFWHGLYDTETYNKITENNCEAQYSQFSEEELTAPCIEALIRFEKLTTNINVYGVYETCWSSNASSSAEAETKEDHFQLYEPELGLAKVGSKIDTYKKSYTSRDYTPWAFKKIDEAKKASKKLTELPPCTFGDPIIAYLNRDDVRSLLHIPSDVQAWDFCTEKIEY